MKRKSVKLLSVLVVMIIAALSCTSVFAAVSPTGAPTLNVVVIPTTGGTGTYEITTEIEKGPNGGTLVNFVPKANDGYEFTEWKLVGDYKIVEGTLTTGKFTIEAFSDIEATPYYTKPGSSSTAGTVQTNTSSTSPKTGTSPVLPIAIVAVAFSAAGAVVVKRKLSK